MFKLYKDKVIDKLNDFYVWNEFQVILPKKCSCVLCLDCSVFIWKYCSNERFSDIATFWLNWAFPTVQIWADNFAKFRNLLVIFERCLIFSRVEGLNLIVKCLSLIDEQFDQVWHIIIHINSRHILRTGLLKFICSSHNSVIGLYNHTPFSSSRLSLIC